MSTKNDTQVNNPHDRSELEQSPELAFVRALDVAYDRLQKSGEYTDFQDAATKAALGLGAVSYQRGFEAGHEDCRLAGDPSNHTYFTEALAARDAVHLERLLKAVGLEITRSEIDEEDAAYIHGFNEATTNARRAIQNEFGEGVGDGK